jgi:predicted DNA-binding transcriptional regulator AlpA
VIDNDRKPDDLMYQNQVSDEFGIPRGTLRHWRSENTGPPSFALGVGGRVVYRRSEILAWLESVERKTRRGENVDTATDADDVAVVTQRRVPHRPRVPHRDVAADDESDSA